MTDPSKPSQPSTPDQEPIEQTLPRQKNVSREEETLSPSDTSRGGEAPSKVGELPEQFGRYKIIKLLGKGGMGAVYMGEDSSLDRMVAIKVPFFDPEDSGSVLDRFQREAKSIAAIQHPNICPIHEVADVDGVHYMAMAFIEGKPLSDFLKTNKNLSIRSVVSLVRKLAVALEKAHKAGVIHRDLKPDNIMINEDGEPVIMDFGLARRDGKGDEQLTVMGQLVGTPSYMSPEQVNADPEKMGPGCDIYSLGVIFYQLLCGKLPFESKELLGLLTQIAMDTPKPPSTHRAEIDKDLDRICAKAMAKKVEDRFSSMGSLAKTLSEYRKRSSEQKDAKAEKQEVSEDKDLGKWVAETPKPVVTSPVPTEPLPAIPPLAPVLPKQPKTQQPQPASAAQQINVRPKKPRPKPAGTPEGKPAAGKKIPLYVWLACAGGGLATILLVALSVIFLIRAPVGTVKIENDDSKAIGGGSSSEPPLAIAPFLADEAKKHQKAWAVYLGRSIEKEFELPGGAKLTMILVPPGEFLMGSTNFRPQHRVRITRPFYLGKYEVTQAQWQAEMGSNPSVHKDNPQQPVESVSWDNIQTFLAQINRDSADQMTFALPTEAQWEFACRAGTLGTWHSGDSEDDLLDYAWFKKNSDKTTHPVGQLKPNRFGLYDMLGNVAEWCADWYAQDYYATSPENDPSGPLTGERRVSRGGSFGYGAVSVRSANRDSNQPVDRAIYTGFRVARTYP